MVVVAGLAVAQGSSPEPAAQGVAVTAGPTLPEGLLRAAQEIAGRSMTLPGTAKAVQGDFPRVSEVAWPGEQPFGDAQQFYRDHRMLVVQVDENVAGLMRQLPPVPGQKPQSAPRIGGMQIYYDETARQEISFTAWPAGDAASTDLSRIGPVVTFDVPAELIRGSVPRLR